MAIRLQRIVSRFMTINQLFSYGRCLSTPAASADRSIIKQAPRLFRTQSRLLNNVKCFTQCGAFPSKQIAYSTQANNRSSSDGADEEQLSIVYENLREHVPMFFVKPMDYSICDKDIVFENRIRGKTYKGIVNYVKQLSYLRVYGHFKYAYVKMDVLKITQHPEDSSVKIRWRISGITGYSILFKMIQFRVWQPKKMIEQHTKPWIDGFSTIYVNKEGRVIRHIVDKVIADEDKKTNPIDRIVDKLKETSSPKIALFVELSTNCSEAIM